MNNLLHINFAPKMLQYSTHVVAKQTFEYVARNKICINTARLFYNDKNSISFLTQYLRKRQSIIDLKIEDHEIRYKPKKEESDITTILLNMSHTAPEAHDFSWKLRWERYKKQFRKKLHKSRYERHQVLGPDLATAKFAIMSGGKVKFVNSNDWIDKTNKTEFHNLPNKYEPEFQLEGLDLREFPIEYENLYTICHLYYLKWLCLKGCNTIDDWCIDKLAGEYPTLEYFDISECKNVTERGLLALYKLPNLKQLVVTDYHGQAAFELTCLMLEDVNPYLKCKILTPEKNMLRIEEPEE